MTSDDDETKTSKLKAEIMNQSNHNLTVAADHENEAKEKPIGVKEYADQTTLNIDYESLNISRLGLSQIRLHIECSKT